MLACAVALAAYAKITLNRWINLGIKEYHGNSRKSY